MDSDGIEIIKTIDDTVLLQNDIDNIRVEIINNAVSEAERIDRRKKQLINESAQKLRQRIPLSITQEMVDLGIAHKISDMRINAELEYRFELFLERCFDDDD